MARIARPRRYRFRDLPDGRCAVEGEPQAVGYETWTSREQADAVWPVVQVCPTRFAADRWVGDVFERQMDLLEGEPFVGARK